MDDMDIANSVVLVPTYISEFLNGRPLGTNLEKLQVLSSLYRRITDTVDPLDYSENDLALAMSAVLVGAYQEESKKYYINVGKPANMEEYLALDSVHELGGIKSYKWMLESKSNAKVFTEEEIDTIVPEAYRDTRYYEEV